MAPTFVFEPPSDEEVEEIEAEEDEQDIEEEGEEDVEAEGGSKTTRRHSQSPWDFGLYSETVAEEHARRSTTSVDFKISKAIQERSFPVENPNDDDESSSESEPDRQVNIFSRSLYNFLNSFSICKRKFEFLRKFYLFIYFFFWGGVDCLGRL